MRLIAVLAGGAFTLGLGGLLHQKFQTEGGWFSWKQFLAPFKPFYSHETLIVVSSAIFLGLLIGYIIGRDW